MEIVLFKYFLHSLAQHTVIQLLNIQQQVTKQTILTSSTQISNVYIFKRNEIKSYIIFLIA